MWKIIGSILVLGACGGLGWLMAMELRKRPKVLAQLQSALGMLATEISYGSTPLPIALEKVGRSMSEPASLLFNGAGRLLRGAQGSSAAEIWLICQKEWMPKSSLQAIDGEELEQLALGLGEAPRDDQLLRIHQVKNRLSVLESEAREASSRLVKVWSYGGVLTGTAIVLIMW